MVLCQFYINGHCRFGSKCHNEHLDVRQLIKTDAEIALKGQQWPLSCYGPFKEKPSLTNFIEDQSFEEVRLLCYEAKNQQRFPMFEQQLVQKIREAKSKIESLITPTSDITMIVTQIYNNATGGSQQAINNPFALNGSSMDHSIEKKGFNGESNIFGVTRSQVFGGGQPASTGFTSNTIFGGGGTSIVQPQQNIFGQSNPGIQHQQVPASGNIFTQQATTPFGSGFAQQQCQGMTQNYQGFGQPQHQQQNQMQLNNNVFGGGNLIQAQTQAQPVNNFFHQNPNINAFQQNQQQIQMQQIPMPVAPAPIEQQQSQLVNPMAVSNSTISDTVYSKIEELSPEILEAFKSPEFVIGKIPTLPPPRELCK